MGPGSSWRRQGVAGLVAAGALACGVAGGRAYDASPDGPPPAPPGPPAGSAVADPSWLAPEGVPSIDRAAPRGSVRFPAGVGYPEALRRLLLAQLGGGELPAGAVLEPALPREVVLVRGGAGEGLRVSLTAPWGYDAAGRIRLPSVALPERWPADRVRRAMALLHADPPVLAEGMRVDAPRLAPCQVAAGTPDNRPPCPERP